MRKVRLPCGCEKGGDVVDLGTTIKIASQIDDVSLPGGGCSLGTLLGTSCHSGELEPRLE